MSFSDLGLDARLVANVAKMGYTEPTPIQVQAIPVVMSGKDLVGLAQTGTGKTAAFALPILNKLIGTLHIRSPRVLVVAPTRELAEQIHESMADYAAGSGFRFATIYGGASIHNQMRKLRDGVDVVIGCPGRLVDHIGRGTLDLTKIEVLVLDEADFMFDIGFLPDIRRLISFVPKKRQTLLFSATMPDEIRRLAQEVLVDPKSIAVSRGEMAATVTHALFPVPQSLKTALLQQLLKESSVASTIIFTRTKHRTKKLADTLEKSGYSVASLQGNLSQGKRRESLEGFKDGKYQILVATDIASRGIDVAQVTHVINYDIPQTVEAYTHRIGRTGRAAKEGEAYTFIGREDEGKVRAIERKLGSRIERRTLSNFDYKAKGESLGSDFADRRGDSRGERPSRFSRDRSSPRGGDRPFGGRDSGRDGGRSFGRDGGRDSGRDSGRDNRRDGDRPRAAAGTGSGAIVGASDRQPRRAPEGGAAPRGEEGRYFQKPGGRSRSPQKRFSDYGNRPSRPATPGGAPREVNGNNGVTASRESQRFPKDAAPPSRPSRGPGAPRRDRGGSRGGKKPAGRGFSGPSSFRSEF